MEQECMSKPDAGDFDLFSMGEEEDPDCAISGCGRTGKVPRKMRKQNSEEPITKHYICQFHHRLYLGIKIGLTILVVALFFIAFFSLW